MYIYSVTNVEPILFVGAVQGFSPARSRYEGNSQLFCNFHLYSGVSFSAYVSSLGPSGLLWRLLSFHGLLLVIVMSDVHTVGVVGSSFGVISSYRYTF